MCDPVTGTIAAATMGLQIAGGAISYAGQKAASKAEQAYYDYQATIADQDAELALKTGQVNSRAIQDTAKLESKQYQIKASEFSASQRAALAANGIIAGVTAEDIANDTFTKQQMDELAIQYNADVASWQTKYQAGAQARSLRNQASTLRIAGRVSAIGGKIAATNTLLGTASSVGQTYLAFK